MRTAPRFLVHNGQLQLVQATFSDAGEVSAVAAYTLSGPVSTPLDIFIADTTKLLVQAALSPALHFESLPSDLQAELAPRAS